MNKLALAIWLFLIAYKIYDMKRPQTDEKHMTSPSSAVEETVPVETQQSPSFDPDCQGYNHPKNTIPKIQRHFSKAMSTKEKARLKQQGS